MSGIPLVMAFGGSDSSGGSGLPADQRAVRDGGGHLLGVATAVTAQGPGGVAAVLPVSPAGIRDQAEALLSRGLRPGAVKCGMLTDAATVAVVADIIEKYALLNPVLDPVLVSTSGHCLLNDDGLEALRQRLLPLAALVTPNIPEAERLTGLRIRDEEDMRRAALLLAEAGARAVLLKGGHAAGDEITDVFFGGTGFYRYSHPRLPGNPRGTGCTLASAIAVRLAGGIEPAAAVEESLDYMQQAIAGAVDIGGIEILI